VTKHAGGFSVQSRGWRMGGGSMPGSLSRPARASLRARKWEAFLWEAKRPRGSKGEAVQFSKLGDPSGKHTSPGHREQFGARVNGAVPAEKIGFVSWPPQSGKVNRKASRLRGLGGDFLPAKILTTNFMICALWASGTRSLLTGAGCQLDEERTSSGAGLFTLVGYHSGAALSRDNMFTGVAQDFFN
jgi:hypothetical protein